MTILQLTTPVTRFAAPPPFEKKKPEDQDQAPEVEIDVSPDDDPDDLERVLEDDDDLEDALEDDPDAQAPAAPGVPRGTEDPEKKAARSVGGSILQYGVRSHPSGPFEAVTFTPGSLQADEQLSRVKLLRDHDRAQPLGVMSHLADGETGAEADFRLGTHAAATDALLLAQDGILDGFSVGVEPVEWTDDADGKGVTITRANLREVSLVALPAYTDARATRVAAQNGTHMDLTAQDAAKLRRILDTEDKAPVAAAPLAPPTIVPPAAAVSAARVLDREGYSRSMPAIVAGRERVDACDYIAASCELTVNGDGAAFERIKRVMAAAGHETSDLVPGLLPQQIVGPILDQLSALRPVWNSLSAKSMPSNSRTFQRPRITQHTAVGAQSVEKTELATRPMKVELEEVTKGTYGGYVNIARQVIDWTSPGALALIVQDLLGQLVKETETVASAALVANTVATVVGDPTDPAALNAAIYQAAAKVYGIRNTPADRVWMSPDIWATIGSLVDGDKRPLFPALNPMNALGSLRPSQPTGGAGGFGGLDVTVAGMLPAGTLIVGASEAVEVYEDQRGTLQAVEPSILGVQVAAYMYAATYAAYGDELVAIKKTAAGGK